MTMTSLEGDLEAVLSAPVCLSVFCSLSPIDLVHLESSCASLRRTLQGEIASLVWATCANSALYRNRINLPLHVLTAMPLKQLKSMLRKTKRARGSLHCRAVPLIESAELRAISNVCSLTAAAKEDDLARVVVARLQFDSQGLGAVAAVGKGEGDEELFCFSSEMVFWLPGSERSAGTMLTAALGCGTGINLLEVSSVIKPFNADLSLIIDVHLAGPLGHWHVMGLEVDVNRQSAMFCIPQLDIGNEKTRACLASPAGVLAILVVRASAVTVPLPDVDQSPRDGIPLRFFNSLTSLNALALELPKRSQELARG